MTNEPAMVLSSDRLRANARIGPLVGQGAFQPSGKPAQVAAIEAARGLCAMYVVVAHIVQIFGYRKLFRDSYPIIIDLLSGYAHEAVICFFLLSGFSIHYVSMSRNLADRSGLRDYFFLRFRRIYPIFLVGICITFIGYFLGAGIGLNTHVLALHSVSLRQALANLLFLGDRNNIPGTLFATLETNAPLWSLSYEIPYYLIYPFLWGIARRRGVRGIFVTGLIVSLTAALVGYIWQPNQLSNILEMYYIWCFGAVVGEWRRRGVLLGVSKFQWTLMIVLMLQGIWVLSESRFAVVREPIWSCVFFVVMVYPICTASSARFNLTTSLWFVSISTVVALTIVWSSQFVAFSRSMPLFYVKIGATWMLGVLAILPVDNFDIMRFARKWLGKFAWLGGISYALYLVHYPILVFVQQLTLRLDIAVEWAFLSLPLPFLIAVLLEHRMQPWAAGWLDKRYRARVGAR